MARPKKIKIVNFEPGVTYFKPRAVPLNTLQEVELTIEELESLRLSDLEELSQTDSAQKMHIHQSTFQRTLSRARQKITDALVNGKAIKIKGGDYRMPGGDQTGPPVGGGFSRRGGGRGGRFFAAGAVGGICICPSCNYEQTHARGLPCNQIKCPKCGALMTRKV
ncbi:MAG: DUF134 domain-containing protein [Candidatus Aenigmarchaeota archaeon]|nr:DUF134 domain-containing protein [Candidatus Aenigmarchaeota archaeon]